MLITIESTNHEAFNQAKRKVSIEIDDDVDIHAVMDEINGILVAWGFYQETVTCGFLSKADELGEEESEDENENKETRINFSQEN